MVTIVILDSKDSLDRSTPESLLIRTVVALDLFDLPETVKSDLKRKDGVG